MQRGFSLVEALFATTLLTALFVGVAQLAAVAARANERSRSMTRTIVLASQKLEQLRGLAWTFDATGAAISDFSTDTTAMPESPSGGTGLTASPADALSQNVAGYCDFLDEAGRSLGGSTTPPANTAFVRRWSIDPLPASNDTIVIQVQVTRVGQAAEGTRLVGVRTRTGG
jgi:type II secretory pathway pseudopilin PulG